MLFDVCDLNFDMLSLVLELDLDIMVTYFYAKIRLKGHSVKKLWSGKSDRWTDMCKTFDYLISCEVMINNLPPACLLLSSIIWTSVEH